MWKTQAELVKLITHLRLVPSPPFFGQTYLLQIKRQTQKANK